MHGSQVVHKPFSKYTTMKYSFCRKVNENYLFIYFCIIGIEDILGVFHDM
jgi:hypothetical protein